MSTVHPSADVSDDADIGAGSRIWHLAQVREGAKLGEGCVIGRGAYIDIGVELGAHVKVQNHALVYAPARLADGVFVGPAAILTNDRLPRAINPDGTAKRVSDWEPAGVEVGIGASIGAGAVLVAGIRVGGWAVVGAGSVVTHDVPPHALVVGNPARPVGWVDRDGSKLVTDGAPGRWRAPGSGRLFVQREDGTLREDA